ncbi:MAG: hypothetical protein ABSD08_05785 [Xanthobacteraceae bacterium]|jgi:hypothetical protein
MTKARQAPRLRTIVLSAFAVLLVWLVVSQSFGAYIADLAPDAALWLHPQQPSGLVTLADRALNASERTARAETSAEDQTSARSERGSDSMSHASTSMTTLDRAFSAFETIGQNQSVNRPIALDNARTVRMWVQTALLNDPLNARALRILGQLAEADDDDVSASNFMHAAARLSLHESVAVYWLMQKSAQAKDDKSAIYYADVLLRTKPDLGAYVVPVLARLAEEKRSNGLLKTVLVGNPPWRKQFFEGLPNSMTDARTPLDLLSALRTSTAPPTTMEVGYYINSLITHKLYGLAYYTWLQFLPPEELRNAGMLFNGSFELTPSGLPFDWKITPGAGVTIDIVPRSDNNGKHGLLVSFQYGRVEYHSVTELVMLAPGTYEFKGKYQGQLDGPRGLKWRIVCAGGAMTRVGESPMIIGMTPAWRNVAFTFTVPATDCPAQYVRLDLDTRMASEQLVTGSMLFDELRISRVQKPPA